MKIKLTQPIQITIPPGTIIEGDDITVAPPPVVTPPAFNGVLFQASFWAKKLDASTPIHPQSALLVAELAKNAVGKPGYWGDPWINSDSKAVPVYIVTTDIPKVPVRLVHQDGTVDTDRPLLSAELTKGFRIPASAVVASASDQQFAVLDTIDNRYFELWLGKKTATGWDCVNAGIVEQSSACDGTVLQHGGEWWGATATHLPCGAGLIMLSDLKAGVIAHELAFAMPFANNKFVWPASASDGSNKAIGQALYPGGPLAPWTPIVPEGTRFRLPASYIIPTTLPPLTRMILTALRDYGMVLMDSAGCFCFATENASQYGVTDILGPYMGGKQLWDIMPTIPISLMQALA